MKDKKMTTTKPSFILAGIASVLVLAACSSSKSSPSGDENDGGGGGAKSTDSGAAPADCKHIDYKSYASTAPVSFKTDIMPIFGFACTTSGCHRSDQKEAQLDLGWRCDYNATANFNCLFPATDTDPTDPSKSKALTDDIVNAVYASVMDTAATVTTGDVKRVVAGDPENSFLVVKLADQENDRNYMCKNTDSSHESNPGPCGVSMPQNQGLFCEGTSRAKFDAVASWVAQGAKNN